MSSTLYPHHKMNLKEVFPISLAFLIRHNIRYISVFLFMATIMLLLFSFTRNVEGETVSQIHDFLVVKKLLVATVISILVSLKLIYDYLYWLRYDYFLERGRLHIESGVLIRQEASVPLTPLCEFYLEKRWIDLLLGTSDLVLKAATGEREEVCRIQALEGTKAKELKRFLIEQTEKNPHSIPHGKREETLPLRAHAG